MKYSLRHERAGVAVFDETQQKLSSKRFPAQQLQNLPVTLSNTAGWQAALNCPAGMHTSAYVRCNNLLAPSVVNK